MEIVTENEDLKELLETGRSSAEGDDKRFCEGRDDIESRG